MTPSEHPRKLPQRIKVGKDNKDSAKKIMQAALDWAESAREKAGKLDKHAASMATLQNDIEGFEAAYRDVVGMIAKLEAQHAKAKDDKKKVKIDKEHAKLNTLADQMVDDLNKRFTKQLREIWKTMQSDAKTDPIKI